MQNNFKIFYEKVLTFGKPWFIIVAEVERDNPMMKGVRTMTIKEKVEILKRMRDNAYAIAKDWEAGGYKNKYENYMSEVVALDRAIFLLTDNGYAKDMKDIFVNNRY